MTSARDLTALLADLLHREHAALADFLVALADFDRRRLWQDLGHASLFSFLHRELGLSKGAAFLLKTAAELLQAHPEIIEPLRDGRLCLSTVGELARVLTPENQERVLPAFFHLSKREAQEVAASLDPVGAPPHREVVTAVRARGSAEALALQTAAAPHPQPREAVHPDELEVPAHPAELAPPAPVRRPAPPPTTSEPLTSALSRLHLTVSREFLEKLEAARDALSHSRPGASAQDVLEAGLDLLLEHAARRKGLVEKPRKEPPPSSSDHVPAHVRREVWRRDGGRCQWPLESGGVCGSTHRAELDHVVPRALGGASTAANLRVLCRPHNDLAARRAYGDRMDRFTRMNSHGAPPPPRAQGA
jgi:hypothetical protein